ncbi:MAG: urea transporter, partial [Spirochaetia bacterium]|nr:urea transporter [Spirochaetia bacterium]
LSARIRKLMPNGFTSGDFIRIRYGNAVWRVFLVISIVYGLGWLVSLGMAGGKLIHALSGIEYWIGTSVILGICVAYTMLGGLRAVIGTDFIQTVVIISGIVILGFISWKSIGIKEIHSDLLEKRPELLNLLMPAALMFLFNNLLFGVGEIFHSNVWWSRALAFEKGVGFRAYFLAGIFWAPVPVAAGFIALAGPSLGLNVASPDMIAPVVASSLLGYGGTLLIFIVIFSALASSVDSVLAATSDLITEDIYRKHIRPAAGREEMQKAALAVTGLLGFFVWILSLMNSADLASVLHFTGALVASTIWPVAAGLYWKKASRFGALFGMILGSAAGLTAYFSIGFYVASLVGAFVSMTAVILFRFLTPESFEFRRLSENSFGGSSS